MLSLGGGHGEVPLWLMDDAHPDPVALVKAAAGADFKREKGDLYPGLRAAVPSHYASWLEALVGGIAGLASARLLHSTFATTSDDPAQLAPIQRIPHYDDASPAIFAAVHYLCDTPHRGTGFFRHRRTGLARITPDRVPLWRQGLAEDARRAGMPPAAYHEGSDARFEQLGQADLRFNRLIIYPANCLHSGDIGESWQHGASPSGRLTTTSLLLLPG
ncbi:MAG: hypothetical protein KGJ57_08435 [Sphingomonadales bacterium]|nr:hypothetical protein [Sphingomonadales bacterium]MDE2169438.1 hypothetical protein [Sphingomonadales bacterium]